MHFLFLKITDDNKTNLDHESSQEPEIYSGTDSGDSPRFSNLRNQLIRLGK